MNKHLLAVGFAMFGMGVAPASATLIDKTLTVEVYVVCDDAGADCAPTGPTGNDYFAAEVNAIWAQAGISVGFSFVAYINSTHFSDINDSVLGDTFTDLAWLYGTHGPSSTTVDLFMVHTVAGAYGEGWLDAGGVIMAMDTIMSYNGGRGRIDTVAHELGHNFGLLPDNLGGVGYHSTVPAELIAAGNIRNVPVTLADIYPSGLGLDRLTADQIALARGSSLLQDLPEPGIAALVLVGLLGQVLVRRRAAAH